MDQVRAFCLHLIKKQIKYKNCLKYFIGKHLKTKSYLLALDNSTYGFTKTVMKTKKAFHSLEIVISVLTVSRKKSI